MNIWENIWLSHRDYSVINVDLETINADYNIIWFNIYLINIFVKPYKINIQHQINAIIVIIDILCNTKTQNILDYFMGLKKSDYNNFIFIMIII